jgi:hypothetical protein
MNSQRIFTLLWNNDYCRQLKRIGVEGEPLRFVWGGHNLLTRFSHYKVACGDYIMPVRVFEKNLYLIGLMKVKQSVNRWVYLKDHPADELFIYHDCANEVLVGEEGTPIRFDTIVPQQYLEELRFVSKRGERGIKYVQDGKLMRSVSLEGVYRLSPESVELLLPFVKN